MHHGQQQQPTPAAPTGQRRAIKKERIAAAHESLFGARLAADSQDERYLSSSSSPSLPSSSSASHGNPDLGIGDANTPTTRAGVAHSRAVSPPSSRTPMPAANREQRQSGGSNDASSTPPRHGASDTADPHQAGLEQQQQQQQPLIISSSAQQQGAMQDDEEDEDEEEAFPRLEEGEAILEVNDLYYGIEVPTPTAELLEGLPPGSAAAAAAPAAAAAQGNKKRVLLNGVNCRICAGDMVAVIVSLGDDCLPLLVPFVIFSSARRATRFQRSDGAPDSKNRSDFSCNYRSAAGAAELFAVVVNMQLGRDHSRTFDESSSAFSGRVASFVDITSTPFPFFE